MSHYATTPVAAEHAQCLVCEKTILNNTWFARVKHGDWTVLLCSERCANAFYAQRLPGLRRLLFRAAHPSLQWPRADARAQDLAVTR